jgi:DNA invertase Pin-like site-specific DNA recombinase
MSIYPYRDSLEVCAIMLSETATRSSRNSWTKPKADDPQRPDFHEMIALAKVKHPPFEVILVWKLNRFARNRADSIAYKKLLRDRGIKLISINESLEDSPLRSLAGSSD